MTQPGFNLITHDWIPVQTKTGFQDVSLETLFAKADEITDITEEAKNRHALYLFLTALAHEAAYQALGRHPDALDLPKLSDAKTLREWCQTYLKSEAAKKAFADDTKFLDVVWPDFFEGNETEGKPETTPETVKDEETRHLSPQQETLSPEKRFRNYLGLQAFYPWGPESGSQRFDGCFHAVLLGPNIATTLRLNLIWLTTQDIENADTAQAQKAVQLAGRAAWAFDINSDEGRENWITTPIGALTPLFRFITRTPTHWTYSACKVWDIQNKKFVEKEKGEKTLRMFPDQLGDKKVNPNTKWFWKYLIGHIGNLQSKLSRTEMERKLTIRVIGIPKSGKIRNSTLEKTYHCSSSPREIATLQVAFPICENLIKKVSGSIRDKSKVKDTKSKRTPLRNLAILVTEEAIEASWNQLMDPENTLENWKDSLHKAIRKELNNLPATTREEFESIEKTKKEVQKLLA